METIQKDYGQEYTPLHANHFKQIDEEITIDEIELQEKIDSYIEENYEEIAEKMMMDGQMCDLLKSSDDAYEHVKRQVEEFEMMSGEKYPI